MSKAAIHSCLDDLKLTPLHHAAMKGHMDIVKFLTVKKHYSCDPLCRDANNCTALHLAVENGHLEVVKFFIEELKCPPDIPGLLNMTPLQMAIRMNRSDIAQYLQKHSVMPYIYTAIVIVTMEQLGLLK